MDLRGIHHIAIRVADLGACERFYAERLGLRVTARHAFPDGRPRSVWLDAGDGSLVMLEQAESNGPDRHPGQEGLHLLAFRIALEERAHWANRLDIVSSSDYTLYAQDPEGNRVALSHYPVAASKKEFPPSACS